MKKLFLILFTFCTFWAFGQPVGAAGNALLQEEIIQSVSSGQSLIVTDYELTVDELNDVYFDLYCRGLLPWFADTRFDWTEGNDGIVSVFWPRGLRQLHYDEAAYEREMAQMLHESCLPGMEPWEMALSIHDYIVNHCAYDYSMVYNTGYHALVRGESACFGYAQLYMDALKRVGISSQIVICKDTGLGVGHAWNVVELDGQWYHVDVTWDDPVPNRYGVVSHKHFLKTDAQFRSAENGHDFSWDANVKCKGKRYSSGWFWEGLASTVVFIDEETAAIRVKVADENVIFTISEEEERWLPLYRFAVTPVEHQGGFYIYPTVGFTQWNGRLYFNSEHSVYSILPDGSDLRLEFDYTSIPDGTAIYSCAADDGKLYLTLLDGFDQISSLEIELEDTAFHVHQYEQEYIDATCVDEGYTKEACSCGITYCYGRIAPLGHQLEEMNLSDGSVRGECSRCDYICVLQEPVDETEPTVTTNPSQESLPEPSEGKQPESKGSDWGVWVVSGAVILFGFGTALIILWRRRRGKQ